MVVVVLVIGLVAVASVFIMLFLVVVFDAIYLQCGGRQGEGRPEFSQCRFERCQSCRSQKEPSATFAIEWETASQIYSCRFRGEHRDDSMKVGKTNCELVVSF